MKGQQLFDYKKLQINKAILKTHGEKFEIVVDPDLAIDFKNGKINDVSEVLKSEEIFIDAQKGEQASESELQNCFQTSDTLKIAEKILNEGEIQLTAEYREKLRAEKKKRIVELIHRNAIDPRTGIPHPVQRIENAFVEAKIHIDEFLKAEDQVSEIIKKMTPILPIRFATKKIQLLIHGVHAAKLYGRIQNLGKILNEQWLNDGSWSATVEIPAGLQNEFFDELNKETHGDIEIKIIE
ncbi:MAG: ribosome assembly factor SBDS [Nanoarchaeota archaeon]|nr:ribosome assembly factor SBDS [Nanoarchaeota archaeon]